MSHILLIDDDPMITNPLARTLAQRGFETSIANNGRLGLELTLDKKPDLVLLDIMMPEMDGWAVCKAVREKSGVPIIMLTALDDEVDRILGLELGADDYLTKPFGSRELIARINAMLRRVALDKEAFAASQPALAQGVIRIDIDKRQAWREGQLLTLRYKEFELLALLMSKVGTVASRAEIFDAVWGTDWLGDTRTLDVHIRWLREKIEEEPSKPTRIQTVRGVGYRFIGT